MTLAQFSALLLPLSPILILAAGTLVLLLQIAFIRHHGAALTTALMTMTIAAIDCLFRLNAESTLPTPVTSLVRIDHYALFFFLLFLFIATIVALLGYHHLKARCSAPAYSAPPRNGTRRGPAEFYVLLLLATLGACILVCAHHFASFILALELLGLALYPLLGFTIPFVISYAPPQVKSQPDRVPQDGSSSTSHRSYCPAIPLREQSYALESALKYLVQSALATALALFGIAMIYAATGSLTFTPGPLEVLQNNNQEFLIFTGGYALLLCGVGFKLSLVPFHIWTADVYEGAPTPVTALLATLAKVSLLALLFRLFHSASPEYLSLYQSPALIAMLSLFAIASMLVGNLLALRQNNIKRLLAYSSIAHMGYLLVAFLVAGATIAREAMVYYLIAYTITTLTAFAVVSLVCDTALPHTPGGSQPLPATLDPMQRAFYRGLMWRAPVTATCFAIALLSLAGIPLTIGFVGKFYLIAAGVEGERWWLLYILVAGSALGLFYYLKLLLTLVQPEKEGSDLRETLRAPLLLTGQPLISRSGVAILLLLTGLLLIFGIYPQPLINGINAL
ncbi:NADH-quinone oxidoreductase subunit N [Microbulbifer sp.]|uniref:NADH-quinone oxidoreductase subunit N n=1 Tax=Microbulbifer sp. TaxID=1908541 RepID=UPI002585212B|nr:NADH-quinone oxidoreductase subunit N [Microbulbifer sp.]